MKVNGCVIYVGHGGAGPTQTELGEAKVNYSPVYVVSVTDLAIKEKMDMSTEQI